MAVKQGELHPHRYFDSWGCEWSSRANDLDPLEAAAPPRRPEAGVRLASFQIELSASLAMVTIEIVNALRNELP